MNVRLAGAVLCACALATAPQVVAEQQSHVDPVVFYGDVAVLRVFLKDGTSLISYGEPARVGRRVVFSMPTSASPDDPQLHLVNLPVSQVDWERTSRYGESVRAARYVATHAETQYAMLTAELGQALNDIAFTDDSLERLQVLERVRKTLADWPAMHFNYREADIRSMLAILDEAIADLRAAAGLEEFDLSFVTTNRPEPFHEPLLPQPTPKEAIEQTLLAARLSESPAERVSLMTGALASIERGGATLPSRWRNEVRRTTRSSIERELGIDRRYRSLTDRMMRQASSRSRNADVRGVERLIDEIHERDRELGSSRPQALAALLTAIDAHLDAARRLQLERDRWALRIDELREYRDLVKDSLDRLHDLESALEDIKTLAGSSPQDLNAIRRTASQVLDVIRLIVPPEECQAAHTMLLSAAQLAGSAADIRREASLNGDIARAWDASSAAAGAMMLGSRAKDDIEHLLALPQLPQ